MEPSVPPTMPTLRRITTYPVKSLDPQDHEELGFTASGALAGDREFAIVDAPADAPHDPETASVGGNGDYVNAKRFAAIHRLRSSVDLDEPSITLRVVGEDEYRTFPLDDPGALDAWLSDYFDRPVSVRREPSRGFSDRRGRLPGPSVISTATLEAVASWFPGIDVDSMRRRFRANLEVDGVPAFWEDRLFADEDEAVAFRVGDVELLGVEPCARCVVPTRDPDTGEVDDGFRVRFIEKRGETKPEWLAGERFDHAFRLMVNTELPGETVAGTLSVGDEVEVLGVRPY